MSGLFGGRDPFDDPFFTRPSGSLFGSGMFGSTAPHDPSRANRSTGPVIQELDSGSVQILGDKNNTTGEGNNSDVCQENMSANKNPIVEHPEDQTDDPNKNRSNSSSKETSYRTDHSMVKGKQSQTRGVSFQRVTYGGINGPYYTASTTRRTGSDGVVLEESKEADSTTGQAAHRISRGIHEKGHSVTRKLDSDGKVDTTRILHNLDEDELASFNQTWKGNADRLLPGWNDGSNFRANSGSRGGGSTLSGWVLPFGENLRREVGLIPGRNTQAHSAGGKPKKVVTIPIE